MISNKYNGAMLHRRSVLKTIGVSVLAAPYVIRSPEALAAEALVVASWGGTYQELFDKIVAKSFTQKTGIPVKLASGPDNAKAKAQVLTGNLEWDVIDAGGPQIVAGEHDGLWEPLDTNIIDTSDLTIPATTTAVPFLLYAGGIAYMPERTIHPLKTFSDFWDVDKLPGRRGLRAMAHETMEIALLADGVPASEIYPLDVERAFRSLDKIKPSIARWISQTPQTISLLQTNEVDYVFAYQGRVATAQKEGIKIELSTHNSIIPTEYLAVLKGSPRKEQAMRFIAHAMEPAIQAQFASAYYNIPGRASAMQAVDPAVKKILPDPKDPNAVIIDSNWWHKNYADLNRRFKEWLSS